jgi:hypothetical protein
MSNEDKAEAARSREIDRELAKSKAQSENTVKLLLLGKTSSMNPAHTHL